MAVVPGMGATLSINSVVVVQVVSISGPNFKVSEIPTTHLGSHRVESRPGLFDPGDLSFSIQYDPALHTALVTLITADVADQDAKSCVLTWADESTCTFVAYLTAFAPGGMEEDGNLSADVTVRLDGSSKPAIA